MRKLILLLIFVTQTISDSRAQPDRSDYPLKRCDFYCMDLPDSVIGYSEYFYDSRHQILREVYYRDTVGRTVYSCEYDSAGNRIMEKAFGKTIYYGYNKNGVLIHSSRRGHGPDLADFIYTYDSNGLLVKETGSEKTIQYFYDSEKRLVKKKSNDTEIIYTYNGKNLAMETNTDGRRKTVYQYRRDADGVLVEKSENGKPLEKYFYDKNRLKEKWIYYNGIDPCFTDCGSHFILKYSYSD